MGTEPIKVIVIGAGWSGIAAAVTYLKINPSIDLTIIDEDSSFGGTWSKSRVYSHLQTDSPAGLIEYSDMTLVDEQHPMWSVLSGKDVHEYLDKYAAKFDLHRRAKFGTKVVRAYRQGAGWNVETSKGETLPCDKLIVAYGQTSREYIPNLPNDGFDGFSMHSKALGENEDRLGSEDINEVTVLGAGKSALECCTTALGHGKKVHLVIKESGNGPSQIIYRKEDELMRLGKILFSKFFAQFTPSIYNRKGFWARFLHSGNPIGRWLIGLLEKMPLPEPDYDANPNLRKLKPNYSGFFWQFVDTSVMDEDSILFKALDTGDLVVHQGDPMKLSKGRLHLSNNEEIPTDAIIYGTGWSPQMAADIFDIAERLDLGLPVLLADEPASQKLHWEAIDRVATEEVYRIFPMLKNPPPYKPKTPSFTPQRLFRQVISPALLERKDRSITFVGFAGTIHSALMAELYSLWAVAWMEDLHPPSSPANKLSLSELEKELSLENSWSHRRYPAIPSGDGPLYSGEIITFWDAVMADLGLKVNRQQKGIFGWYKEYFSQYTAQCYAGALEELLENAKKNQ